MTASFVGFSTCGILPAIPFPQESHNFPSHFTFVWLNGTTNKETEIT
ncbi:hypothetical protein [Halobacillus mangrovi]